MIRGVIIFLNVERNSFQFNSIKGTIPEAQSEMNGDNN